MTGARIRIVEDNEDLYLLMSRIIAAKGWNIASPMEAIDCLLPEAWEGVDLGIIDLMMPEVSGVTILRYVREHHASVKLLVITAAAEHTRQEAIEWADAMLGKPFDIAMVFDIIGRLVGDP